MYNYNDCLLKDGSTVPCVKPMLHLARFTVRPATAAFWNETITACSPANASATSTIATTSVWSATPGWGPCLPLPTVWDSPGLYSENFHSTISCVSVFHWSFSCLECWIFTLPLYVYLPWSPLFSGWSLHFSWHGIPSTSSTISPLMKEGTIYTHITLAWGRISDIFLAVSGTFAGCSLGSPPPFQGTECRSQPQQTLRTQRTNNQGQDLDLIKFIVTFFVLVFLFMYLNDVSTFFYFFFIYVIVLKSKTYDSFYRYKCMYIVVGYALDFCN